MILSADKLNQRSPYHLMQINDMAFGFVTDQQIRYNVGFYPVKFFMGEGVILSSYQEFLKHVPERFTIREK